jgi:hypothetical protein
VRLKQTKQKTKKKQCFFFHPRFILATGVLGLSLNQNYVYKDTYDVEKTDLTLELHEQIDSVAICVENQNKSLVNKIYQATKTSNPWVKNLQAILQNLGFSFIVNKDTCINIKP